MNHKTEICYNSIGNSIRFEREMKKKRLLFDGDGGILRHDLRFVYIYCGSGSPSIRALGKYWHNWIHPRNSMSTFRGNRAHGAKCTGNVFISLLSQPKRTDEIETEIDLYGKCIRNHGNPKREYNQCKRENKQKPNELERAHRIQLIRNRSNIWANKNAGAFVPDHSGLHAVCCCSDSNRN